jgi:uroporphyrinogen-III decarboxylase
MISKGEKTVSTECDVNPKVVSSDYVSIDELSQIKTAINLLKDRGIILGDFDPNVQELQVVFRK